MRGFEQVHSSRAGDGETTTEELDNQADGPWADGPREELSPVDQVRADGPRADVSQGMLLQMEADPLDDPPTDRGKQCGLA